MGYSHCYYKKEIKHDDKTWNSFLKDVRQVASRFKLQQPQSVHFITDSDLDIKGDINIKIGDGLDGGGSPEFDEKHIWFNGVGKDAFETFHISKDDTYKLDPSNKMYEYYKVMFDREGHLFGFTKTNRKPYDLLVTATLVLYKHHFKHKVDVKFDDGYEGFKEGIELVNSTLGYTIVKEDIYNPED